MNKLRKKYEQQLRTLHDGLIQMGALCEESIASAAKALIHGDDAMRRKAIALEQEINLAEHELGQQCVRLLLLQQPMAGDLRHITAAQRMMSNLERVGDQAADIAEISEYMKNSSVKSDIHIAEMAKVVRKMLTLSIDAFVKKDIELAEAVIKQDDLVDDLFLKIKTELVEYLIRDNSNVQDCLDLLMVAKYFERIGDHAENIAECVMYYLTGEIK
ncbi:MAG: phosphate signaling complex protein PhoU [Oscillospiraceae bacterium]|nr:phosphate signaling complex protein PhoU [Oscillospiraceae bacterium]